MEPETSMQMVTRFAKFPDKHLKEIALTAMKRNAFNSHSENTVLAMFNDEDQIRIKFFEHFDKNKTCTKCQCNIATKISHGKETHSAERPDQSFLEQSVNPHLDEKKRQQQQSQSQQVPQQQQENRSFCFLPSRPITNFNNDNLVNDNNSSEENMEKISIQTDEKHETIEDASGFGEDSTAKPTCSNDDSNSKSSMDKATSSTTEFGAANKIQNSTNRTIKKRRFDKDSSNLLRPVLLQEKRTSPVKRRASHLGVTSSTVSVINDKYEEEILYQFLYPDLINCKSCVSIYSSCSDCSSITQRLRLSEESLASRRPKSALLAVNDLKEAAEAYSTFMAHQQHYRYVLDKNKNKYDVGAADISETSLVNKRGTMYIAGCKLDFPEGTFQTTVNVKLGCFFPSQVMYDDGVIVSPEIEIECEVELMKPYSVTMPTCYFSTKDNDQAQITTQFYDGDDGWRTIDFKARFCFEHSNVSISFESNKSGRFRCVVMDSECSKLSKNMVSTCFLRRCENLDQFGIVWYLVDDWHHLASKVLMEMLPETVYEQVFCVNLSDVKYGTEIHLLMNEEEKFTGGEKVVIGRETLWKSFVSKKIKFDLESLKKMKFAITNNDNRAIFHHVEQWDAREPSGSLMNINAHHTLLSRKPSKRRNRDSSQNSDADASGYTFTTAMTSTSHKKTQSRKGIKAKFQKFMGFGSKRR